VRCRRRVHASRSDVVRGRTQPGGVVGVARLRVPAISSGGAVLARQRRGRALALDHARRLGHGFLQTVGLRFGLGLHEEPAVSGGSGAVLARGPRRRRRAVFDGHHRRRRLVLARRRSLLLDPGPPVVLDLVVGPAGEVLGDLGPLVPQRGLELPDDGVLRWRDAAAPHPGPQVVEPPQPAALPVAVEPWTYVRINAPPHKQISSVSVQSSF
jgi:hypothetical protein